MVIALNLAKDLNKISLEELVSSFRSQERELEEDEPRKQRKFVSLKYKPKKTKAYQDEKESKVFEELEKDRSIPEDRKKYILKNVLNGRFFSNHLDAFVEEKWPR